MAKKDLEKMSLADLKALKKEVEAAIAGFGERKRNEARLALEAVAKQHGMSIEDILGAKKKTRKARVAAKYRNPDNSSETWSGRGRQPGWYKAAIAAGKSPESLEI